MRRRGRQRKAVFTVSLFLVAVSVIRVFSKSPPEGIWVGVYSYYPTVWGALLASAVLLVLTVSRKPLPWGRFLLYLACLIIATGSISLVWGVPFRSHDPWAHLGFIRFGFLGPLSNPYPAFHTLIISISETTDIAPIHWLSVAGVLISAITSAFIVILVRRLPGSDSAKQVAVVAILPAAFMRFSPRPFSFAWAFTPLMFWLIFMLSAQNSMDQSRRYRNLCISAVVITPVFHPQFSGFLAVLTTAALIIAWFTRVQPYSRYFQPTLTVNSAGAALLVISAFVIFTTHLILYSNAGLQIIGRTAAAYISESGPTELQQASSGTGIFGFYKSIDAAVETLSRLAYIIIVGSVVAYESGVELINRRIDSRFATGWITSALIVGGFLSLLVLLSALGVERIVTFTPLVAVPVILFGLINRKEVTLVILAILCITAGLGTVYASDITGQAGPSTNARQVAGVDWLSDYNNEQPIVGTYATDYIIQAQIPYTRAYDLTYRPPPDSKTNFDWQIRGVEGLYVTDGTSRALLQQYSTETQDTSILQEYEHLSSSRNRIYSNSDTSVYNSPDL